MTASEMVLARARNLRCRAVQQVRLAPFAIPMDLGHGDRCLVCQAEEARERSLTRLLASLRDTEELAPQGFVDRVMATLDRPGSLVPHQAHRSSRRLVLAASASAVAAAVALVATRRLRLGLA